MCISLTGITEQKLTETNRKLNLKDWYPNGRRLVYKWSRQWREEWIIDYRVHQIIIPDQRQDKTKADRKKKWAEERVDRKTRLSMIRADEKWGMFRDWWKGELHDQRKRYRPICLNVREAMKLLKHQMANLLSAMNMICTTCGWTHRACVCVSIVWGQWWLKFNFYLKCVHVSLVIFPEGNWFTTDAVIIINWTLHARWTIENKMIAL